MSAAPTICLPTDTPALFDEAVQRAVTLLRDGAVIGLPTETVYGLAANALNARAVARIFEIKGRPAHNPIICHVASHALARHCVAAWPGLADRLARAFWPGPLTLVLPRSEVVPDVVTAGGPTVGIRWPSHPFMQAVINACQFPLAAPSANLSNQLSPTCAAHVLKQLDGRIPLVVDGGECAVGIESTVVDVTGPRACVLRPGMIHDAALSAVAGELGVDIGGGTIRSPGMLRRHYSPKARLWITRWRDDAELRRRLVSMNALPSEACVVAHTHVPSPADWLRVAVVPHDPEAYGRALYAELSHCDEAGAAAIVVEELPAGPEWRALADRLSRAAAAMD